MDLFVPGRLCILGEHSDWAANYRAEVESLDKGMALVCTTNEGLHSTCHVYTATSSSLSSTSIPEDTYRFIFHSRNNHGDLKTYDQSLSVEALEKDAKTHEYFSYVAGTAAVLMKMYADKVTGGILIDNYLTTLPIRRGLSSSAAVCVTVARAFDAVFRLNLSLKEIMEIAYLGEIMTSSKCGRMDQCCAMGKHSIGLMTFDHDSCSVDIIRNVSSLYFVVADLCAGKDTVAILTELNACFPTPKDDIQRLMHKYVNENVSIANKAVRSIQHGDVGELATCIKQAQSLFDECAIPNCPSQLTAPKLHSIISNLDIQSNSLAVKGVGSQGDGSVQILCEGPSQQSKILEILTTLGCDGFLLTIPPPSSE